MAYYFKQFIHAAFVCSIAVAGGLGPRRINDCHTTPWAVGENVLSNTL